MSMSRLYRTRAVLLCAARLTVSAASQRQTVKEHIKFKTCRVYGVRDALRLSVRLVAPQAALLGRAR